MRYNMKCLIITIVLFSSVINSQDNFSLLWTGQHAGYVNAIAVSSNGSRVFSGSYDKTVKAWNASNGNLLWSSPFDGRINSIDVSTDGKYVVAASSDKTVRMLDAESGAQLWIITDVDVVIASLFCSFDTRVMIANEDNQVKCLFADNGNVVWIGNHDSNLNTGVNFLSISSNGNFAASGSDRFIKVWNITTQLQVMIASTASNVSTVYFNPDYSRVISADWSGNVRIWNATTGTSIATMIHSGIVNAARYSPDGSKIVSIGNNRTVKLWDFGTGQQLWTGNHNDEVVSVAFSPDGTRIASGSGSAESLIKIWNTTNGNLIWTSPFGQAGQTVSKIIFSPDGNKIFNTNFQNNSIKCWTKVPTSVDNQQNIPTDFSLSQNYPNPFNPETIISYQLTVNSWITLKVYDTNGREVATLLNEYKQPGTYNCKWKIENGELPSGIYFYRLTASNSSVGSVQFFSQTKKLLLLK